MITRQDGAAPAAGCAVVRQPSFTGRTLRVGEALECGRVGIHTGRIGPADVPFGGDTPSGLGRAGACHGIADHLELTYRCLGGISHVPGSRP